MKLNRNVLSVIFLVASIPMVVLLLERRSGKVVPVARFATFNTALNRETPGAMLAELRGGKCEQARKIAEIVQRNAIDVLLVCELDRDSAAESARILNDEYFAVSQNGAMPIDFTYVFCAPSNTGEPTGLDLDHDGKADGPGDAYGFGSFPGQYGMALFSRHQILSDQVRTFRLLKWADMPGSLLPKDYYPEPAQKVLRLSSKSHWDVPIRIGLHGTVVHALCSHPTPPVFDGAEDRNGRRNHDEIRFWTDYLTPGAGDWIVDDAGGRGGLAADQDFVVMGDLNSDPVDGDGRHEAVQALLALARVQDPRPKSTGGPALRLSDWGANAEQHGDPALDTFYTAGGKPPGNLRLDYVLPAKSLHTHGTAVFWPAPGEPLAALTTASDHRLVWLDVEVK
jgi:Endonuclease/Exonuclease/phosphatase family